MKDIFQRLALGALLLLCSVIAFLSLCFIVHIPVGWYSLAVPLAVLVVYSAVKDRKLLLAIAVDIGLLTVWAVICGFIMDWSFDGMYFHKEAVIALKEGWNPLYTKITDVDVFANYLDTALWSSVFCIIF